MNNKPSHSFLQNLHQELYQQSSLDVDFIENQKFFCCVNVFKGHHTVVLKALFILQVSNQTLFR